MPFGASNESQYPNGYAIVHLSCPQGHRFIRLAHLEHWALVPGIDEACPVCGLLGRFIRAERG